MAKFTDSPLLTDRYTQAVNLILKIHSKQIRKGHTKCPYITHPLTVSSLVLEAGGTEDEAIAALLHDAVEDVNYSIDSIKQQFGSNVSDIVAALSEDKSVEKSVRKQDYVNRLQTADISVIKVSIADKLHNIRGYSKNPQLVTAEVINFYQQLLEVYCSKKLPEAVENQVIEIKNLLWKLTDKQTISSLLLRALQNYSYPNIT